MKYRQLADTGVFVSELCLGAMTFGGQGQIWQTIGGLDQASADAVVHGAIDAGINFIDTANVYSTGESETIVGKAIAGRRHGLVLATKVRGRMGPGPNDVGLSRLHIIDALDASLKRLGTDYVDLYQIHRFDPLTNIEDTLRAMDDLVRAGKVRYIGCSNLPAWQLMKALGVSREQRLERFRCTQSYYSLVGRDLERDTIPLIRDQGLGLLVWSPLAGGFLSGKFTREGGDAAARRATFDFPPVNKEKGFDVLDVLSTVAARHGVSVAQIALAWLLGNTAVTSVIIGARRLAQLEDNLKAIDVQLSAEDLKALDDVSKVPPAYPEWMDVLGSDRRPGERRY
ncbi:MAG TPA: aldo/keto reductase [Vicinamibacterales bacterium]|jgi:aryl-alcohol dehydrogenase-like predicted oxidoreductase|nr:aldo/keto reductase [Vicinamibacterales bacterium]